MSVKESSEAALPGSALPTEPVSHVTVPHATGPDLTAWKALARKDLRGAEAETLGRATPEGLTLKPL